MNCSDCPYEYICCSKRYGVTLSRKEIKQFRAKTLTTLSENRRLLGHVFVLNKNENGMCVYWDEETKMCNIYEKRPEACKNYDCTGKF